MAAVSDLQAADARRSARGFLTPGPCKLASRTSGAASCCRAGAAHARAGRMRSWSRAQLTRRSWGLPPPPCTLPPPRRRPSAALCRQCPAPAGCAMYRASVGEFLQHKYHLGKLALERHRVAACLEPPLCRLSLCTQAGCRSLTSRQTCALVIWSHLEAADIWVATPQ